jgi:hypothetical protein
MEKILVKMEKMEKMEQILTIRRLAHVHCFEWCSSSAEYPKTGMVLDSLAMFWPRQPGNTPNVIKTKVYVGMLHSHIILLFLDSNLSSSS